MSGLQGLRGPARVVGWVLLGTLGLLLVLMLVLAFMDWNTLRGPVSRAASRALHRQVEIGGNLRAHLFSWTPSVDIEELRIANAPWAAAARPLMANVPRLHVAVELGRLLRARVVIADLELDRPDVALTRDTQGRANWDFTNPEEKKETSSPSRLPPIRRFALNGGDVDIRDEIRRLTFKGQVGAQQGGRDSGAAPFSLKGHGTLNKEPFDLELSGDPLLQVKPGQPYRFQTQVRAGPSQMNLKGTIAKPFDLGDVSADIALKGQNLANLYYLTNLALPLTPPYELSVMIHRRGNRFALEQMAGRVGESDVQGAGSVDLASHDARPRLRADLTSHALRLSDLGVALGARVEQPDGTKKSKAPPQVGAPRTEPVSPLLLPTYEFQFDRLRSMDADVTFRADSVMTQSVPIRNVSYHLALNRGDLEIDPLEFVLPEGKLAGRVELDARGAMPQARADLRLSGMRLDQFHPKGAKDAPLEGVMEGRMRIDGTGDSVHAIGADANGTVSLVLPDGRIQEAFAELAGIDVVRGLGLLLTKKDQTVTIRCGIIEFQLRNGNAQADRLLFDTENVLVSGEGHINLADEAIDLNIKGEPEKPRIGRIRAPVNIRGTLRHPQVSVSAPALAKQGAAAAVLGAVATPFAALLAFVDPGLARKADCAALKDEAQDRMTQPVPPTDTPAPDQSSQPEESKNHE